MISPWYDNSSYINRCHIVLLDNLIKLHSIQWLISVLRLLAFFTFLEIKYFGNKALIDIYKLLI